MNTRFGMKICTDHKQSYVEYSKLYLAYYRLLQFNYVIVW